MELLLEMVEGHPALLHHSPFELAEAVDEGQILEVESLGVAQHLHQQEHDLLRRKIFKEAGQHLIFFEIGVHGVEYLVDWPQPADPLDVCICAVDDGKGR